MLGSWLNVCSSLLSPGAEELLWLCHDGAWPPRRLGAPLGMPAGLCTPVPGFFPSTPSAAAPSVPGGKGPVGADGDAQV